MARISSEGEPGRIKTSLTRIFPPASLAAYLDWEGKHKLTESDQWSGDPERQRLYLISNAASKVFWRFRQPSEFFSGFPDDCMAVLTTGVAGTRLMATFTVMASTETIPEYQERTDALLAEVEELAYEKGFRPDLLTAAEHKKIGSTVGRIFDVEPNVPIAILRKKLLASGRIKPYDGEDTTQNIETVIEETDRARRLSGMTFLDLPTGAVTDQIDEAARNDSYIFLSADRKAEVKRREEAIRTKAEDIARANLEIFASSARIVTELDSYSNGVLPFGRLTEIYEDIIRKTLNDKGPAHQLSLTKHISGLRQFTFENGKWDRILTPQEILSRAGGQVDERYLTRPHTPLAIQDGQSVDEISRLRADEGCMVVQTSLLEHQIPLGFRLEELDTNGTTIKDPTFVDRDYKGKNNEEQVRSVFGDRLRSFPFERQAA